VGNVAYKLQLPADSKIHPVVHVSQLKQALPPTVEVSSDADFHCISPDIPLVPLKLLKTCERKVGNSVKPYVLVSWMHLPATWTTWENLHYIKHKFPGCTA
jgi:hypothetical protein